MTRRLVVEADGGSRGNPGVAGWGALVRDPGSGRILVELAAPLGTASNNVAEYSGLIAGLKEAAAIDPAAEVTVRMDSKLVVEQMSGRWKIKHADMRRLADEAREIVADVVDAGGSVAYEWIPRERNKDADRLSNEAMDGKTVRRELAPGAPASPAEDVADETAESVESAEGAAPGLVPAPSPLPRPRRTADPGPGVRLVLVRDAVSEATVAGRYAGRGGADPVLSAEGMRMAQATAGAVRAFLGADASVRLVTSSLRTAVQTGQVVAAALAVSPATDADWDEQAFGEWDGRTPREVSEADPETAVRLRAEPGLAAPGGETRQALTERVATALDRAAGEGGTVVVVAHRGSVAAALATVLDVPTRAAWSLAVGPGSLTSARRRPDGPWLVEFVNDRSHLR